MTRLEASLLILAGLLLTTLLLLAGMTVSASSQDMRVAPAGAVGFLFDLDHPGLILLRVSDGAQWRTQVVVFLRTDRVTPIVGRRRAMYDVGLWK